MTVIGVIGENSGGKETFTKLLEEVASDKKIVSVRFSEVLHDTLKLWDLPQSRDNFTNLSVAMNTTFGDGTLAHAMFVKVTNLNADIIVLDGVRWPGDEKLVRQFSNNILLYVTTDVKLRYERSKARREKAGEETATFEKFLEEEKGETEIYIPDISSRADYKIENNGDFDDYKIEIKKFYEEKVTSRLSRA